MEKRRAFTLIELMVVISVIVILVSLMAPRLSRATEKARGTTCLNNMHQIGIASALYTEEFRDIIVPIAHRVNPVPADRIVPYQAYLWWPDTLRPYTKAGPKMFSCPSVYPTQAGVTLTNLLGIGMNFNELGVFPDDVDPKTGAYVTVSSVKIPAATVIFADSAYVDNPHEPNADLWVASINRPNYWQGFGVWIFETPPARNDQWNYNPVRVFNRHDGLANCAFVDGHIDQAKSSSLGWQYPRGDSRALWDR